MTVPTPTSTEREALQRTLAASLERGGFLGWLLSNGDNPLWAERSPEDEVARVVMLHLDEALAAHDADLVQRTRDQVAAEILAGDGCPDQRHRDARIAREGGAR